MAETCMTEKLPGTRTEAWRELYPFDDHWFDIGGGNRMHYLDEGQGTPVVMLHGNPTWSFFYRDLVKGMRHNARCIVPDHIGCGLSDKPQHYSYRLKDHIDNLECLLDDHLGLMNMDLVVHDWGGAIGMGYAIRYPERIRRIVVLNTAAFLLLHCPWRIRVCKIPFFGSLAIRALNAFAGGAVSMAVRRGKKLTGRIREGYLRPYDSYRHRIANLRFVHDIPLSPEHPTWETMCQIQDGLERLIDKPMLICWGMQDFCFDERFLTEWRNRFPQAEVNRFENAGHYVLEDAGEEILSLCTAFLLT